MYPPKSVCIYKKPSITLYPRNTSGYLTDRGNTLRQDSSISPCDPFPKAAVGRIVLYRVPSVRRNVEDADQLFSYR